MHWLRFPHAGCGLQPNLLLLRLEQHPAVMADISRNDFRCGAPKSMMKPIHVGERGLGTTTEAATNGETPRLVDRKRDVVSRRIFHDSDIYERELELIFRKSWLLVGHESQIPNVGDFFL